MRDDYINIISGNGKTIINLLIGYYRSPSCYHGIHVRGSAKCKKPVSINGMNTGSRKMGKTVLILMNEVIERPEIFMIAVDEEKGPEKTFIPLVEIIIQLGLVYSEVPEMNDARN
jgi:hypothetical protein